jgi:ArsR family transcriptional regulator, arsenate/arsenite/antimonite-responsive transcriptional repressor
MPGHERVVSARTLVEAAKAIGHPARLRILAMLHGRSLCVCQMTAVLELAPSTVSGHLNELRRSGLVVEDKQGKLVYYALDGGSPFHDLVRRSLALVAGDERVITDRALVDRVVAVPIEIITGAGFRLTGPGSRSTPRAGRTGTARTGRSGGTTRPRV